MLVVAPQAKGMNKVMSVSVVPEINSVAGISKTKINPKGESQ